jgi:hypothetical protein
MLHNFNAQPTNLANLYFAADSATGGGNGTAPKGASEAQSTSKERAAFNAAQRFTEILCESPYVKEFIKVLEIDPKKFAEALDARAKGLDESLAQKKEDLEKSVEQQKQFIEQLRNLQPTQAAKDAFTEFISKAFTHQQTEYMISLVMGLGNDPRLADLFKAGVKAVDVFEEVVTSRAKKFVDQMKDIFKEKEEAKKD